MRRTVLWLVVVIVTMLAGCNSLFPAAPDGTSRGTYDVPDRTTAVTDRDVTTGSETADGRIQAARIAEAHGESLCGRSFEFSRELVVESSNGTTLREAETVGRVGVNRSQFRYRTGKRTTGQEWTYDRYWSSGGREVVRSVDGSSGVRYTKLKRSDGRLSVRDLPVGDPTYQSRVFRLVRTVESVAVVRSDEGAEGGYLFISQSFHDLSGLHDVGSGPMTNVTLVGRISERGVVERLSISYDTVTDGRNLRIREELRFEDRGRAGLSRPWWLEDAPDDPSVVEVDNGRSWKESARRRIGGGRLTGGAGAATPTDTGRSPGGSDEPCETRPGR